MRSRVLAHKKAAAASSGSLSAGRAGPLIDYPLPQFRFGAAAVAGIARQNSHARPGAECRYTRRAPPDGLGQLRRSPESASRLVSDAKQLRPGLAAGWNLPGNIEANLLGGFTIRAFDDLAETRPGLNQNRNLALGGLRCCFSLCLLELPALVVIG